MEENNIYAKQDEGQDVGQTPAPGQNDSAREVQFDGEQSDAAVPAADGVELSTYQSSGHSGNADQADSSQDAPQQNHNDQSGACPGGCYSENSRRQDDYQNAAGTGREGDDRNGAYQNNVCQNGSYQNSGYQSGSCQNSGYQSGSYQNGGCQNDGYRDGSNQNGYYQSGGNQNGSYRNSGYQNSGCQSGSYQNSGYQNGSYQNGGCQNDGYRDGSNQNGYYQSGGYQNDSYRDGGNQNGYYQNGAYQNNGYQNGAYSGSIYPDYGSGYQQYNGIQPGQGGQPELEEPVKVGEWVLSLLLMMIPCVNIIMMFVWAFSNTEKKSKSNFFKAYLIFFGISIGVLVLIWIAVVVFALILG